MGESANESRPKLVAVPRPEAEAAAPAESSRPGPDRGGRGRWPLLAALLAAALLATGGGWILSAQESARLEQSLAATEAALGRTRAALQRAKDRLVAFESHVQGARDRVSALVSPIGALDRFLAADPAGPAGSEPAPPKAPSQP